MLLGALGHVTPLNPHCPHCTGVAGRIDYDKWNKTASDLTKQLDEEEEQDKKEAASALGLDGKHARSQAEADELAKMNDAQKTKKMLEQYKKREDGVVETLSGLLAPGQNQETKFVTRAMLGVGKRVITICDTSGPGRIVLTQDLSNLESATPANTALQPKVYADDAENNAKMSQPTVHRGLIKLNLRNLSQCTVVVKCKVITGTVEVSHCKDFTLIVEGDDATVSTIQADLCDNLDIQFHDSPSSKNVPLRVRDTNSGPTTTLFWGQDSDDRIYHAGVSRLRVRTFRDTVLELETTADYVEDGAKARGNASAEECQFVTSILNGKFATERVLTESETKGLKQGSRPMTERELKVLERKKNQIEQALDERLKDIVKVKAPNGNEVETLKDSSADDEPIEEVFASRTQRDIDGIVSSIDEQKAKGNEAFTSGEYAQAVLFYTLALDRAADLPDKPDVDEKLEGRKSDPDLKPLYPRHVILSNRSACFLKLGHHEKALKDGSDASTLEPTYVKGVFRKGLALHAMGNYREAIDVLAAAQKIEPKNKQIKQALTFAEVRMTQEIRKRME